MHVYLINSWECVSLLKYVHVCIEFLIHQDVKTSGSESRPRKLELMRAHK